MWEAAMATPLNLDKSVGPDEKIVEKVEWKRRRFKWKKLKTNLTRCAPLNPKLN